MKRYLVIILTLCTYSCSSDIEKAHQQLLATNPLLDSDSLRTDISYAIEVWNSRPWSKDFKEDVFRNYILPPQIANEPIEYYWRTDIPRWIELEYKGEELLEFARLINSKIEVGTRQEDWGNEQMGYTTTMSGKFGKCDDRTILAVMAMRSMGVPAAFGLIPMWGSGNNGHSFCSVLSPDYVAYTFQLPTDNGTDVFFHHKVPKIYHLSFFSDPTSPTYCLNDIEDIPELFSDGRLIDATSDHPVGFRDVYVKTKSDYGNRLCYLAVFHPKGWTPIACGILNENTMMFHDIGTGVDINGNTSLKGENIGDGILYLPIIYENGKIPTSPPLIVSKNEIRILQPSSETETVTLSRKFPRLERISMFANRMIWGLIEVANKPDFSDAVQVYHVYSRPLSRIQRIMLEKEITFRYIRFRKPTGPLCIAELQVYDKYGNILHSKPISSELLSDNPDIEKINDNAPLTFFEVPASLNLWVGLDLGQPVKTSSIGFCPRNDDNEISPGDTYELLYWDGTWKSLGNKQADDYSISYGNVPKNALLWLRNRTKGREERPFTYDNQTQIWW